MNKKEPRTDFVEYDNHLKNDYDKPERQFKDDLTYLCEEFLCADIDLELMDYKQLETAAKDQIRQGKFMLATARRMLYIAQQCIKTLEEELKNPKVMTEEEKKNHTSKIDYAG